LSAFLIGCGSTKPPASPHVSATAEEAAARAFVDEMAHGAWDHPKTPFGPKLAAALPPDRLRGAWSQVEAASGRFFECKDATTESFGAGHTTVSLECVYEHTEKTVAITFDEKKAVIGLFYKPSQKLLGQRVRTLIEKANDGDFAAAEKEFGEKMRAALPPDKLAGAWRQLVAEVGRFQSIEEVKVDARESVALAKFEKSKIRVKVVWDEADKVIGLFFAPDRPWTLPPYAKPDAVVDTEIEVGSKPALPGTLSLPKGEGKVPAVVLIHGSGPGSRDEVVGGVRVFADLAHGLAARGIGVLRYDKRSLVAPAGVVTEKEEVLDAAEEAIALLRKHPRVDARRIFVIGHSQGGNLAPRIAAKAPELAGYVTLAGPTRPFPDVVLDQYEYFAKLHPENEELQKKVEQAREFKRTVESPALKPDDDPHSPFGGRATGAYYLFQRGYDPVATAKSLGMPILVLQGGRDYQVTSKDYDRWKAGLEGLPFATLKWFPEVNHLFVAGEGPPSAEEYAAPNHVDERVITTIADWIAKSR
jgi:pimeloyl-ACP methyl ester carboxylesterase